MDVASRRPTTLAHNDLRRSCAIGMRRAGVARLSPFCVGRQRRPARLRDVRLGHRRLRRAQRGVRELVARAVRAAGASAAHDRARGRPRVVASLARRTPGSSSGGRRTTSCPSRRSSSGTAASARRCRPSPRCRRSSCRSSRPPGDQRDAHRAGRRGHPAGRAQEATEALADAVAGCSPMSACGRSPAPWPTRSLLCQRSRRSWDPSKPSRPAASDSRPPPKSSAHFPTVMTRPLD